MVYYKLATNFSYNHNKILEYLTLYQDQITDRLLLHETLGKACVFYGLIFYPFSFIFDKRK